jgi:hypothetical protein
MRYEYIWVLLSTFFGMSATLEAGKTDALPRAVSNHWAFQPLLKVNMPLVSNSHWPQGNVDAFLLHALEETGIEPSADVDPYTWLRRVSLDLTGFPPSVEDIRRFTRDFSVNSREHVVDRLLASHAFGERWARHWLDLVGYADQIGTSNNVFAQHAWRYRDYVISALNRDLAFDQFIRQQIAGDLLPFNSIEERASQLTATGFLVLGDIDIVEADKSKLRVDIVDHQLNKIGKAFLGMTFECARCHDHKFDPISQEDYYGLAGFLHGTSSIYKTHRGVWSDVNILNLPETETEIHHRKRRSAEHGRKIKDWSEARSRLLVDRESLDGQLQSSLTTSEERETLQRELEVLKQQVTELDRLIEHAEFFLPGVPKAHGVRDVEHPLDMRVNIRGNPRALGKVIPRGFPSRIGDELKATIPVGQSGRGELADWVVSQPITARVVVNRVWQKLFGEGLVKSVDYFGVHGETPSHPLLLDHLAGTLVDEAWSLKQLIRRLVLSRAYGMGSQYKASAYAKDPGNRLLWRMTRVRLDAEALRDSLIFSSGTLKRTSGHPSLPLEFPENVGGLNPSDVNPPSFRLVKWRPGQRKERTIYLPVIRHAAQPGPAALRDVFDFPQPSQPTGKRSSTSVPTQALFLMNSPEIRQHAAAIARRVQDQDTDHQLRLAHLWLLVLNRPVTPAERAEATRFLDGTGAQGWKELCHALISCNEFLMR